MILSAHAIPCSAVISVLTIITIYRAIAVLLPRGGSMTWIDHYFLGCLLFCVVSMFLTVMSMMKTKPPNADSPPAAASTPQGTSQGTPQGTPLRLCASSAVRS